jgi:hypothetical protein
MVRNSLSAGWRCWLVVGAIGASSLVGCGVPGLPSPSDGSSAATGTDAASDGTEPGAGFTPPAPCTLLTDAEVSEAVGRPMHGAPDRRGKPFNGSDKCYWNPDGVKPGSYHEEAGGVAVGVLIRPQQCEDLKDQSGEEPSQFSHPVAGIGDGARDTVVPSGVQVVVGDYCFSVESDSSARIELAKLAAARLR